MTRQAKAALNNTNDDTENFDDEELEEKNHIEQFKLDRRVFSSRNATISSKTKYSNHANRLSSPGSTSSGLYKLSAKQAAKYQQ